MILEQACLEETIRHIPARAGVYAVQLHLPAPVLITIGSLGTFCFPAGDYVYAGSACGPGGLGARLGRHLRGAASLHWHVDFLRSACQVSAFTYQLLDDVLAVSDSKGSPFPGECRWIREISLWKGAFFPVAGFGASDCRYGCQAHLVGFPLYQPIDLNRLLSFEN